MTISKGGESPAIVRGSGFRDENHQLSMRGWGHAPLGNFGIFDLQRVLQRLSDSSLRIF